MDSVLITGLIFIPWVSKIIRRSDLSNVTEQLPINLLAKFGDIVGFCDRPNSIIGLIYVVKLSSFVIRDYKLVRYNKVLVATEFVISGFSSSISFQNSMTILTTVICRKFGFLKKGEPFNPETKFAKTVFILAQLGYTLVKSASI